MKRSSEGDPRDERPPTERQGNGAETAWIERIETMRGPRYLAIIACLEDAIRSGQLPSKTRLPPQRRLADMLGLTVGTTSRAYTIAAERGLITGETGRGTFVRDNPFGGKENSIHPMLGALATNANRRSASPTVPHSGQVIDLALHGIPMPEVSDILARATVEVMTHHRSSMPRKYITRRAPLRYAEAAARWLRGVGMDIEPNRVVVTGNGYQAIATTVLCNIVRGEAILTDSLTYAGVKALAFNHGLRLEAVERDEHGLRPDALERAAAEGLGRIVFTQSELHNPTASVMPLERRKAIAEIARKYDLLLIEDHAALSDMTAQIQPIAELAPEHTFLIASATKSTGVSVSAGYVVTPPGWGERFELQTRDRYFQIDPLGAEIMTQVIESGAITEIAKAYRATIGHRLDLLRQFLPNVKFASDPRCFFVWLALPQRWRSEDFASAAGLSGVTVAASNNFAVGMTMNVPAVRLSLLGSVADETFVEGLRRLEAVMENGNVGIGAVV